MHFKTTKWAHLKHVFCSCFVHLITSLRYCSLRQQFSTCVLQAFLKQAIPGYLVRGTDLFFLRLSNKKMTTANTTVVILCEWMKIILIFLSDQQKIYFLVHCRILVISLCAMRWKRLKIAAVRGYFVVCTGFRDLHCVEVTWVVVRSPVDAQPVVLPLQTVIHGICLSSSLRLPWGQDQTKGGWEGTQTLIGPLLPQLVWLSGLGIIL